MTLLPGQWPWSRVHMSLFSMDGHEPAGRAGGTTALHRSAFRLMPVKGGAWGCAHVVPPGGSGQALSLSFRLRLSIDSYTWHLP